MANVWDLRLAAGVQENRGLRHYAHLSRAGFQTLISDHVHIQFDLHSPSISTIYDCRAIWVCQRLP